VLADSRIALEVQLSQSSFVLLLEVVPVFDFLGVVVEDEFEHEAHKVFDVLALAFLVGHGSPVVFDGCEPEHLFVDILPVHRVHADAAVQTLGHVEQFVALLKCAEEQRNLLEAVDVEHGLLVALVFEAVVADAHG